MISLSIRGPSFDGPLDLLLALVRRNQYPLEWLPIAEITRQFESYIRGAEASAMELGADFIETASWLVLLKSRALLPPEPGVEPAEQELRRVLLDHHTVVQTALLLESRMQQTGLSAARVVPSPDLSGSARTPEDEIAEARQEARPTVQDALEAARRALAVARAHASIPSASEEGYPVEAEVSRLLLWLASEPGGQLVSTETLFRDYPAPEARVALLLGLLEVARLGKVRIRQPDCFGPIYLKGVPAGQDTVGVSASVW